MISEYLPVVILLVAVILLCAAILLFPLLTSQKARSNFSKDHAYECGLPAMMESQPRFSVKFYLVAMLFILFDVEVVFLYPWAVVYKEMVRESAGVFISMLVFLGILFLGFFYALRKGALNWKK